MRHQASDAQLELAEQAPTEATSEHMAKEYEQLIE